jgi:hypothetical protein
LLFSYYINNYLKSIIIISENMTFASVNNENLDLSLKVACGEDIRRVAYDGSSSFSNLRDIVAKLFGIEDNTSILLKYEDVVLTSDSELEDALKQAKERKVLKVTLEMKSVPVENVIVDSEEDEESDVTAHPFGRRRFGGGHPHPHYHGHHGHGFGGHYKRYGSFAPHHGPHSHPHPHSHSSPFHGPFGAHGPHGPLSHGPYGSENGPLSYGPFGGPHSHSHSRGPHHGPHHHGHGPYGHGHGHGPHSEGPFGAPHHGPHHHGHGHGPYGHGRRGPHSHGRLSHGPFGPLSHGPRFHGPEGGVNVNVSVNPNPSLSPSLSGEEEQPSFYSHSPFMFNNGSFSPAPSDPESAGKYYKKCEKFNRKCEKFNKKCEKMDSKKWEKYNKKCEEKLNKKYEKKCEKKCEKKFNKKCGEKSDKSENEDDEKKNNKKCEKYNKRCEKRMGKWRAFEQAHARPLSSEDERAIMEARERMMKLKIEMKAAKRHWIWTMRNAGAPSVENTTEAAAKMSLNDDVTPSA